MKNVNAKILPTEIRNKQTSQIFLFIPDFLVFKKDVKIKSSIRCNKEKLNYIKTYNTIKAVLCTDISILK